MGRRRGQRKGHLTERSGSWLLRWREDSRDITGRPIRQQVSMIIGKTTGPDKMSRRQAEREAWDRVLSKLAMLKRQGRQIEFTGGLEAAALEDYQVGLLSDMRPRPNCFFAYDPGDPFDTLRSAASRMIAAGFTECSHRLRTYVLIGYPKDTFPEATKRLEQMISIGFTPHAMLWQPETPAAEKWRPAPEWGKFQRQWARPAIIHASRHGVAA